MLGQMQHWPLLLSKILVHAERSHGDAPILSLTPEGVRHQYGYADLGLRARKASQALTGLGVGMGDRVATLAWNTHRHMELWYAISGMGAVCHTVNPRLFDDQLTYIVNHAGDYILCFDLTFLPLVERLAPSFVGVAHYVLMTDRAHMPASSSLPGLLCYEELVEAETGDYAWPEFDENTASGLCYTSGTTGHPKGVLYSHRSTMLHSMAACMADTLGVRSTDCVMPVVPMFHANAWGVPYCAPIAGAKLVLNGPHFDAPTLHRLITEEGVVATAAVPTVWLAMLHYLEATGKDIAPLKHVTIGGSAAPRSMIAAFQDKYGVRVNHAWGMTELSPLGTIGTPSRWSVGLAHDAQLDLQTKQGRTVFGVEMKITGDDGEERPRDGATFGHLKVKGPWTVERYFKDEGGDILDPEGFFDTGDVATLDGHGTMQITDRAKDVIKSGGEWISSIDLENTAVGHPEVREAAVIGIAHPKWDERPLLIVVPKQRGAVTKEEMLAYLKPRIAKWWLPDDVVFVDELPHTATGKIQKLTLRDQFKDYRLPTA